MKRTAIVWFRQDLRIHDNEALHTAMRNAEVIIPVYVFDDRVFHGQTPFGFRNTGRHRAQFIIESVHDLRQNLTALGSNLIVRIGKPEEILPDIAFQAKAEWIFCNRERTRNEVAVQDAVEQKLWSFGAELWYSRGKMLYYTQDLPMPVNHTPDAFVQFRKENEDITPVRLPLPSPTMLPALTGIDIDPSEIPDMADLGYISTNYDPVVKGGESEGLKRLRYYLWEKGQIELLRENRNGIGIQDGTSLFSPWLAQGCLSPKMVYHELRRYEHERSAGEGTQLLFYELLWRDYLRLMGKKYCERIFDKGGPKNLPDPELKDDFEAFHRWAEGQTGNTLIDACMHELAATGWICGKCRQLAATFLIRELKVNWQLGAEWFESMLIDYDPCSNWGNWNLVAGIGPDTREERSVNFQTIAKTVDPKGAYVKKWRTEEMPFGQIP